MDNIKNPKINDEKFDILLKKIYKSNEIILRLSGKILKREHRNQI